MSAEKLIHDAADQCEWDPDMVVSVLADFIDEFCDPDDFKAFLEARVADEAGDDLRGRRRRGTGRRRRLLSAWLHPFCRKASGTGQDCVAEVSVEVEPPAVLAHEAACFMQPVRSAAQLAAGNEFNRAVVGVLQGAASHLQSEPLQASLIGRQSGRVVWTSARSPADSRCDRTHRRCSGTASVLRVWRQARRHAGARSSRPQRDRCRTRKARHQ
jgi:hypothetical protein